MSEIITPCKVILVNPATNAAGERSFSSARRLKTWLRSTMTQTRFSNLTILNTHKQRTDELCLIDVANEFAALNEDGKSNFGTFKESDLKMSRWHWVGTFRWPLVHWLPRWTWSMDYLNGLPMDYPKWTTLNFVANMNLTMLESGQKMQLINNHNYGSLAMQQI